MEPTNGQTQASGNGFDARADKWWESRWAFVMAIAIPLISIMSVYTALEISDAQQKDAITSLQTSVTLFQDGDFKDQTARIQELTAAVNQLSIQVGGLTTVVNGGKIPPNK